MLVCRANHRFAFLCEDSDMSLLEYVCMVVTCAVGFHLTILKSEQRSGYIGTDGKRLDGDVALLRQVAISFLFFTSRTCSMHWPKLL